MSTVHTTTHAAKAEAYAILTGLNWALNKGVRHGYMIQSDSEQNMVADGIAKMATNTNPQTSIPSKHENGGLGVGPRRSIKSGAIGNPETVNSDESEITINHLSDDAAAVVMPYGINDSTAKLRHKNIT
nr:hypothetical protein Iba_chr12eCG7250 [Ipomoea batatas]